MAYLNLLASVSWREVESLRLDASVRVKPSKVTGVSHLIGSWIQIDPLREVLAKVLNEGKELNAEFWHPFRPPLFHDPEVVQFLRTDLEKVWQETLEAVPVPADDWYRQEIERTLGLLHHAASRWESVLSVLEPPSDRERAARVIIPFATTSQSI
jgi:hypothetical protein